MMVGEISILLRTSDDRGDHAADVLRAFEYRRGETVEELVDRLALAAGRDAYGDAIEIRIVEEGNG